MKFHCKKKEILKKLTDFNAFTAEGRIAVKNKFLT